MKTNSKPSQRTSELSEALAVAAINGSANPGDAATALLTAAGLILDRDFGPLAASALMIEAISVSRDQWARRNAN